MYVANLSVLEQTAVDSQISASSTLAPKGGRWKKVVVASLMLTSLVDAFSILVVYLLVNMSNSGEILYLSKNTELPAAAHTNILQRNTIVKLEEGKYFIEEVEIPAASLVKTLLDERKKWLEVHPGEEFPAALTIQADKSVPYEQLNAVILAGSHAGYSDINFAVLQE